MRLVVSTPWLFYLFVKASTAQTINNNDRFADSLTNFLYDDTGNDCTSSLGVSMALSLLYPSAIDESEEQMRSVLGYPTEQQQQLLWQDSSQSLTDRYQGRCFSEFQDECFGTEPLLEIANRVFVHNSITLNETYQSIVGDYVDQIDFQSVDAGALVNSWVNASTDGLIDSIVEDGSLEPWVLLAVNSIYLKGSWRNQFAERLTNTDMFYSNFNPQPSANGNENSNVNEEAHFMNQVDYFQYSHDALPGFQVLQHHFVGDANTESSGLSMIFVLPIVDNDSSSNNAQNALVSSADVLNAALPNLERTQVAVALPKFKFESKYDEDLKTALQSMGMNAPFDSQLADNMCIASDRCDAYIDFIIQKTMIDVNEMGVEAAAVTAAGVSLTMAPPPEAVLFLANHPFQFFLYDDIEQVIVFEGRVVTPGIVPGSNAPLTATHTDTNFWLDNFGMQVSSPFNTNNSSTTATTSETLPTVNLTEPTTTTETETLAANAYSIDVTLFASFADALTSELYEMDENQCTSSLGVSMAMSIVYPSAVDETEVQMRSTFGYPVDSQNDLLWDDISTELSSRYEGVCLGEYLGECSGSAPRLEIANSVFVDDGMVLNATYAAVVGEYVKQLDFASGDAGGYVNSWVNESTNGLIDSIVEDGPIGLNLLVVNTIYLKASWNNPFAEARTNADLFYKTPGIPTQAHFMNQVDSFLYSHEALPGYQVLQHHFKGLENSNGLSMIFVLPLVESSDSESAMVASSVDVIEAIPSLHRTDVAVSIPKFKYESVYEDNLKAALGSLGLTAPFEGDLCIFDDGGSCSSLIDLIIQKTVIDMNEKGVEAAAVTAVGIRAVALGPSNAVVFLADRPFQFFLYDESQNVVIFEGRVVEPSIPDGSEAQMEGSHADADFWSRRFRVEASMPQGRMDSSERMPPSTPIEEPTTPSLGSDQTTTTTDDSEVERDVVGSENSETPPEEDPSTEEDPSSSVAANSDVESSASRVIIGWLVVPVTLVSVLFGWNL